jgi:hypothetical protein
VRSKTLSKSADREITNHGKNGKNNLQLNAPDPLPLKSKQLQALLLGGKYCCPAHRNSELHIPL